MEELRRRPPAPAQGVTLTEIVLGVMIMAIVIFPSLTVIMSETKAITGTREHTQAAFVAERVMEAARTYNFDNLPDFGSSYQAKTFSFNNIAYIIQNLVFEDITTNDTPAKVIARKLSFSVQYKTREGRESNLEVATIIARHD